MPLKSGVLLPEEVRYYLNEHKLDEAIAVALAAVVKKMPADPLGHMACALAAKAEQTPPRLAELRPDAMAPPEELRFDILVGVGGVRARLGSISFSACLYALLPPPEEDAAEAAEGAGDAEAPPALSGAEKARRRRQLADFLQSFFQKNFAGASVYDLAGFQSEDSSENNFHERCSELANAPLLEDGCEVDLPRATAAFVESLLEACARALDIPHLELFQRMLGRAADVFERSGRTLVLSSPALRAPADFQTWHNCWPRLAVPVFFGGGPGSMRPASLRVCAAFTPFAAGSAASADASAPETCPAPGWCISVANMARSAAGEAVKLLSADKATAGMVVEGIAYGHPGGLQQTVALARQAAEAVSGGATSEVSGVLVAAADEAWQEDGEAGVYELEVGKPLPLEGLVEFYAQLLEDPWIRMIVRPFRPADMVAGCELLQAQRPDVRLVIDAAEGEDAPVPPPPARSGQGAQYSCAMTLEGSAALALRHYVDVAPTWCTASGYGHLVHLGGEVARMVPSALEIVLACADPEVVLLAPDVAPEDLAGASASLDELLGTALTGAAAATSEAEAPGGEAAGAEA